MITFLIKFRVSVDFTGDSNIRLYIKLTKYSDKNKIQITYMLVLHEIMLFDCFALNENFCSNIDNIINLEYIF